MEKFLLEKELFLQNDLHTLGMIMQKVNQTKSPWLLRNVLSLTT
jgi:hypothetical protein